MKYYCLTFFVFLGNAFLWTHYENPNCMCVGADRIRCEELSQFIYENRKSPEVFFNYIDSFDLIEVRLHDSILGRAFIKNINPASFYLYEKDSSDFPYIYPIEMSTRLHGKPSTRSREALRILNGKIFGAYPCSISYEWDEIKGKLSGFAD